MTYIYKCDSPLGGITLTSDGENLTGLWFDGQKHFGSTVSSVYDEKSLPVFDMTVKWLEIYFSGSEPRFMPPVSLSGTPFRLTVWETLRKIPYGGTVTYSDIAVKAGFGKSSVRAVGGAVGYNPISIIIPCHRVIGLNGKLTGYAGGTEKKQYLLALEAGRAGRPGGL